MAKQVGGAASRQLLDRAYFLDLLGDSHNGLGRHGAAVEAYQQAAEGFKEQGAQCSYALCLFKIAESYLSLYEPWHAASYLELCLPLLTELGLVRHQALARELLARCQMVPAQQRLPGPAWGGKVAAAGLQPAAAAAASSP
jgi:hypothetical protein